MKECEFVVGDLVTISYETTVEMIEGSKILTRENPRVHGRWCNPADLTLVRAATACCHVGGEHSEEIWEIVDGPTPDDNTLVCGVHLEGMLQSDKVSVVMRWKETR